MKKTTLLGLGLVSALTLGAFVGGIPGASPSAFAIDSAATPAATCTFEDRGDVTRVFYEIPMLEEGYYSYFVEELDSYREYELSAVITAVYDLFGGQSHTPPHLQEFLLTELPQAYDTYAQVGREVVATEADAGGIDANGLKALLSAEYEYEYGLYRGFVTAYNADRVWELFPTSEGSDLGSLLGTLSQLLQGIPEIGTDSSYQQLPNSHWDLSTLTDVYTEVHAAYTAAGVRDALADERTLTSMRDSVLAWVEVVDLDYITAYQTQVQQYLEMSIAFGYVFSVTENQVVLDHGQSGTRPLTLRDVGDSRIPGLYMNSEFFDLTVDASGEAFLSPEEVFASDGFQWLVENVMSTFDGVDASSQTDVVEAVEHALRGQYDAMAMPGSSSQPVAAAFSSMVYDYVYAHHASNGAIDPELRAIPDWRDDAVVPGETPYDSYRAKNYLEVPFTLLAQAGTDTVTREITFSFEDGAAIDPAQRVVTQAAEFTCLRDAFTGEVTWEPADQQQTFPAITEPEVTHPAANATVLPDETQVPALVVRPGDENTRIDAVLPVEFEAEIDFLDEDGTALLDPLFVSGRWNTTFAVEAPKIPGFALSSQSGEITGRFGADLDPFVFTYHPVLVDPEETDPGTGGTTGGTTGGHTPGAGLANTGGLPAWGAATGAALLLAAGGALMIRRRRKA